MNKVLVEFGYECRGFVFVNKEVEIEFVDERDFVKKCLMEEFGDEEECVEYWRDFWGEESMEEVVDCVIKCREEVVEGGGELEGLGYMSSEEGFFRIKKE